jgi:hypothetical protein
VTFFFVKPTKTGLRVETSVKMICFTVFVLKSCDGHFSGDAVEDQFLRERCMQSQEEQNRYILLASLTVPTAFSDPSTLSVGAKLSSQHCVLCITELSLCHVSKKIISMFA